MSQRQRKAYRAGREHGKAAGSWIIDRNTTDAAKLAIARGYDDGDPEVMDMCPAPLSGEWAGESVHELSEKYVVDLYDDDKATDFEDGFTEGFWDEVIRAVKATLTTEEVSR